MLDALESEMTEKRNALLRQAVRADPELLVQAGDRIQAPILRERLQMLLILFNRLTGMAGWSRRRSDALLAKEWCAELLAPLYEVYETLKALSA